MTGLECDQDRDLSDIDRVSSAAQERFRRSDVLRSGVSPALTGGEALRPSCPLSPGGHISSYFRKKEQRSVSALEY